MQGQPDDGQPQHLRGLVIYLDTYEPLSKEVSRIAL
jgi:hypothetical protein